VLRHEQRIFQEQNMSTGDPRYVRVNDLWASAPKLPCSKDQAAAMARRVYDTFGLKSLGGPRMTRKAHFDGKTRNVWVDAQGNGGLFKGWARLAHDTSHRINRRRHPSFPPHDNTQARLEWEISCYVVAELIIAANTSALRAGDNHE
jgi:hypothetical protein